MKTLYLECNMGAAGDMLLAALYELLEDKEGFVRQMNGLGLPGVTLRARAASTCGIAGTHMEVAVNGAEEEHCHDQGHGGSHDHPQDPTHSPHGDQDHHHAHHSHATPKSIGALIDGLNLPPAVRRHAREVYDAIAQAEAKAHGCPVGEVHYHEVGALDAVADVTGVCYALHLLGAEAVVASPIHVGYGTVRCQHGVMPVPAPATAQLLRGIPTYAGQVEGELCTPTGAALLAHFAQRFGPMPLMRVSQVGVGIGSRQFDRANCVRAFWGECDGQPGEELVELVCNIDDMTPEALSFACTQLLELGALDVYTTPGTMKKGRPGHVLTVLCRPEQEGAMARHVLEQTTTNGLRSRRCGKYFLAPGRGQVQTQWGPVAIKLARGYGVTHLKPEFSDAARLARENAVPYHQVMLEVARKLGELDREGEP